MPGSRFDKFFCEEFAKKIKIAEEMEDILIKLKGCKDADALKMM